MAHLRSFSSSAALQQNLLDETEPDTLIVVPHRRLARQVWHKQRLANLKLGRIAWAPLNFATFPDWWRELYNHLWPPYALAPRLVRLGLWRRALEAGPPLEGTSPDLEWAQALDEAHDLLLRHALPLDAASPAEPPLVGWRRGVTRIYRELLREQGWLAPGEVPDYLLAHLDQARGSLPSRLVVVGLQTLAPLEERWLEAVTRYIPVTRLLLRGNPDHLREGLELPDREEEMAWVAARLLECHQTEQIPLHRLAVTSPVLDRYAPRFQSLLRELLGPAAAESGCAYNLSHGPSLADTPLWNAALLPLIFLAQDERREDLVALLLSPYYQAAQPHQAKLAVWDRRFRDRGVAQSWASLRAVAARGLSADPALSGLLADLEHIWSTHAWTRLTGAQWVDWLQDAWTRLQFPGSLEEQETSHFNRTETVLRDFAAAFGDEVLPPAGVLSWLNHGAGEVVLPGPGVEEAGVQVLGWLEMRGLDFERVFCLGMNSGAFPGSARPLPLLSQSEGEGVLGGTQDSQDRFARDLFDSMLGSAPHLTLTRPVMENQEPQVGTPFFLGDWQPRRMPLPSQSHPAWVRVPAVLAALTQPEGGLGPRELQGTLVLDLPKELHVTQVGKALGCPLRFVLEDLLGLKDLPEIEAGLDPRERGEKLHKLLAKFVELARYKMPPADEAEALFEEAARLVLGDEAHDVHWQAERRRWFGDPDTPGLLPAWLALEQERLDQGWRWLGVEVAFQGLARPGWPFTLKGRLDRLDFHPRDGRLLIWDYKTGDIPTAARVFDHKEEFQLPGYLCAVQEGQVEIDVTDVGGLGAGFICLKSSEKHLRHQDFAGHQDRWADLLADWEEDVRRLGELLRGGSLRPAPRPAPKRRDEGACRYCRCILMCHYQRESSDQEDEP
ncbi:MAG: PD-(D/E)XK nuclease family protein [Thermodesulfobacteriota bacterium]